MMRANGMDPSMMNGMDGMSGMSDPANMITLYKARIRQKQKKVPDAKKPGERLEGKNRSQAINILLV